MNFKRNDEVAAYKRELVKDLAAGVLANPHLQTGEYSKFAKKMTEIADAIIKELEKE